ncbi:hypothetical protein GCM10022237_09880 [Nocardioides ginsengisoli]|uniref:Lipoprotein n=1 Tax=Nocardioides ginsengisoli TaxID=363868 RepID=A0ABW3VZU3_9ACTN
MAQRGPAALTAGALAALVLFGGCGGSSHDPKADASSGATTLPGISLHCAKYADTAQRITDAQKALYDGHDSPGDATAVDDLVAALEAVKKEAPAQVDAAVTDLEDGFRSAQRLLRSGDPADSADLDLIAVQLAEDSQVVTTWIAGQCA